MTDSDARKATRRILYQEKRAAFFAERPVCEDCKEKPSLVVWSKSVTGGLRFLRVCKAKREALKHLVLALCHQCELTRLSVVANQHYHLRHNAGCRCRKCKLAHVVHESTEALKPRLVREVSEIANGLQRPPETKRLPAGMA